MDIEDQELYAECEDDNENTDIDGLDVDDTSDKPKSNYQLMKERKDAIKYRRFTVTLLPKQVYRSFRKTIKKDLHQFTDEELLTIYRVLCDAINEKNEDLNLQMYKHIRARVERAYTRFNKRRAFKVK